MDSQGQPIPHQDPILLAQTLKQRAVDYRTRVLAGEQLSDEEVKDALACIRQQRKLAAVSSPAAKRAANAPPARSATDLLGIFGKKQEAEPT